MGERQRPLGEGVRLLQATCLQVCLPEGEQTARLYVASFRRSGLLQRLCEQRHGVGNAPSPRVRRPQGRSYPREKYQQGRFLTDAYGPFEERECPGQIALAEGQQTKPPRGNHEATGLSNSLR